MKPNSSEGAWGLTSHPTVWGLAMVLLLAIGILAVLRHMFGSIRITAGADS